MTPFAVEAGTAKPIPIDAPVGEQRRHERRIGNVTMHEGHGTAVDERLDGGEVPSVGESIEDHQRIMRVPLRPMLHEIAADEAGTTGHEQAACALRCHCGVKHDCAKRVKARHTRPAWT